MASFICMLACFITKHMPAISVFFSRKHEKLVRANFSYWHPKPAPTAELTCHMITIHFAKSS